MRQAISSIWEYWKTVTGIGVIVIWFLMIVFGGDWHLKITFGTLGELIKIIRKQ